MIIFKLFIGVHEQSYIAHAIEYAAGWHDQVQNPSGGNANYFTNYKMLILMILVQMIIYL